MTTTFSYRGSHAKEDPVRRVKYITFSVSRYRKYLKTLHFNDLVTINQAVRAAERYLSQPVTEKHFERVKDDLFHSNYTWEQAQKEYKTRGDLLTDAVWLEGFHVSDNGELTMDIGS